LVSWSATRTTAAVTVRPAVRRRARESVGSGVWVIEEKSSTPARAGASATFLALLARDAQGGARERLQACLAHGATARLARPVRACRDARERTLVLLQEVTGVVRERELLLPLGRARTRVGLIVASAVASVAQQLGELTLCR